MNDSNRKRLVSVHGPITMSIHEFPTPPILYITISRGLETEPAAIPFIAAQMIRELSKVEEAQGGRGLHFDAAGSKEGPTTIVLRLFPRLIDGKAAERMKAVTDELSRLIESAKAASAVKPEPGVLSKIDRALQPETTSMMMSEIEIQFELKP